MFTDGDLEVLGTSFEKVTNDLEREIRFQSISKKQFMHLFNKLSSLRTSRGDKMKYANSISTVEISTSATGSFRRIYYPDGRYKLEIKKTLFKHHIPDWNLKFCLSRESIIQHNSIPVVLTVEKVRHKNRHSFWDLKENSALNGFRLDLTEVRSADGMITYEIELEILCNTNINIIKQNILTIYGWIHSAVKKEQIISITEQKSVIESICKLYRYTIFNEVPFGALRRPVNLKLEEYGRKIKSDINYYKYTVKYDGERGLIYYSRTKIYLYTFMNNVLLLGENNVPSREGTLIDGEWMSEENVFYAFDLIFLDGSDLQRHSFGLRQNCLELIVETSFYKRKKYYDRITEALMAYEANEKKYDGIIFQPKENTYIYKWKPASLNTIDFLTVKVSPGEYILYVVEDNNYVKFVGTEEKPFQKHIFIKDDLFIIQNPNNKIIEFYYENNTFIPMRYREDKTLPNSSRVARDIYNSILHQITKDDITNLWYMAKNYHETKNDDNFIMGTPPKRSMTNEMQVGKIQKKDD